MPNKLVRCVVLAGVALTNGACQSMVDNQLKTISAGHTGCTPDQITITKTQQGFHWGDSEMWNATCNGKVYLCSGSGQSYSCAPVAK
jgi:hypothetical protein